MCILMVDKTFNLFGDVTSNYKVHENMLITPSQHKPFLSYRYADDYSSALDNINPATEFQKYSNSIHSNITFTTEMESNNRLSFLDVLVDYNELYQVNFSNPNILKDTQKEKFCAFQFKINWMDCLFDRCYKIREFKIRMVKDSWTLQTVAIWWLITILQVRFRKAHHFLSLV